MEIFLTYWPLVICWYLVGLTIIGIFFYKVESAITIIEIIAVLVVSCLGPITIAVPLVYFLDKYGRNIIFKW